MIQFNELRITPDANFLIIEAQVKVDSFFNNIGILSVSVNKVLNDTYEKKNLISWVNASDIENIIVPEEIETVENLIKKVRFIINKEQLDTKLINEFLEVVIETEGTSNAPEGYANPIVYAPVVDLYSFYINILCNIRMLDNLCSNSNELVDCILRFKALELAMKTGNKNLAAQYWFKYFAPLDNISGRTFAIKNTYG